MLTESLSYEDTCYDAKRDFQTFDNYSWKWHGRKILEGHHDPRVPSLHASSIAHQQQNAVSACVQREEKISFSRISVGSSHPPSPITHSKLKETAKPTFALTSESNPNRPSEDKGIVDTFKEFAKGVKDGAVNSVKELPSTISTGAKVAGNYVLDPFLHPLNHVLPGQELVLQALSLHESLAYLQTCDKAELAKILVPEVYELYTHWAHLSPQERATLAGYALGKYGTDLLMPVVAAKGIKTAINLAKIEAAAGTMLKEAASVARVKKVAEAIIKKAGVLDEALDSTKLANKSINYAELTPVQKYLLSEELQKDIAEVVENTKAAIKSEAFAEGKAFAEEIQNILSKSESAAFSATKVDSSAILESAALHKKAKAALSPFAKKPMLEELVRAYIHETGIPTFPRPKGIPEDYLVMISGKGAGMEYVHPTNSHTRIRIMPGKPHSPNPSQQKPYVIQQKYGKAFDKSGNLIIPEDPQAHIPLEEFVYKE